MEKKHLIMGTAGHVDHGKTSLIRALTGYDCDTHKQEKDRGITINLGFWHLDLPDGNSVGIIDVPGHADFIKTMVSGVNGIDFVLLVIAADEGIMPQSVEHLEIMQTLGIKHGLVVMTKIDLVDEEILELAREEIRDFLVGTFLENTALIPVSSVSGIGLPELIGAITAMVPEIKPKDDSGHFRMFIDRIFTRPGFGTVVNGSVLNGRISADQSIYMLPGNKEYRIRRLERHGQEVSSLKAGDRAALNLVGFKQKDFCHGMVLSSRIIAPTRLIDARIRLFKDAAAIKLWSQVVFLLGTIRMMVRMHLLNKNILEAGEEGLFQIYMPQAAIIQSGDRFIIRNSSGDRTLGGGYVIDPYPLHHRRRRSKQIENVEKIASGRIDELVAAEVRKSVQPLSLEDISHRVNAEMEILVETVFHNLPGDITYIQGQNKVLLLGKKDKTKLINRILTGLKSYHEKNPLLETGKSFQELMGIFSQMQNDRTSLTLQIILGELEDEGRIRRTGNTWVLTEHKVDINSGIQDSINLVWQYFQSKQQHFCDGEELKEFLTEYKGDRKKAEQIIIYLIAQRKLYNIKKFLFQADYVHEMRELLIGFLQKNETGISVAEFRDLIDSNRQVALQLLEFFDASGLTIRKNNKRFFQPKIRKQMDTEKV